MQASPTASTASTAPTAGPVAAGRTPAPRLRRVIDAPTRMFHWLFALSFAGAYLTAESERWRAMHVTLGYTLAGLLVFRVLYGLFGPRHAGQGALFRKLSGLPAWLREVAQALRQGRPATAPWRQGQNLLMAVVIVTLLAGVLPLTLSGYGVYNGWGDALGDEVLEEVHGFFGNTFLAVVLGHLALLLGLSLLRGRNQARPMLTGKVEGPGPDLVRRNHRGLAALLLVAVLAFFAWQWQQAPQGLWPTRGAGTAALGESHDADD